MGALGWLGAWLLPVAQSAAATPRQGNQSRSGKLPPGEPARDTVRGLMMLEHAVSPLVIRLFGPFELSLNGRPPARLKLRRGQWALALLALRAGGEVDRGWLAGTLWPDSS